MSKHPEMVAIANEFLRSGVPALQTAALTCISRNRIEKKAETAFPDSYIRNIDSGLFTSPYVQIVYNRLRILV